MPNKTGKSLLTSVNNMVFFKENLRFLRKQRNLTQAEMLDACGFKRGAWNNYETGASTPNFSDILKIADFFNVSPGQLFDFDFEQGGKVPEIANETKNDDLRNVNGKVSGKVEELKFELNEAQATYKTTQMLLDEKEKIILAQQGQIEALNKALSHAERMIGEISDNKNNRK
jgi:transcriptional regulator with XRE-family HTH domain